MRSDLVGRGERFEVNMRLAEAQAAQRVSEAFVNAPHHLYRLAPRDAPWLVSLTTSTAPVVALSRLQALVVQLRDDLPVTSPALSDLADWLAEAELEALVRLDWEVAEAFAGELMLVGMPAPHGARRSP